MPRLVDYAVRFDFIRRAAFAVVRDDGVDALSRRRVAAELGTSVNTIRRLVADWVDLVGLAADHDRAEVVVREAVEAREVVVAETSLLVTVDEGATAVAPILRALDAAGLQPTSITVNRPTLDDVFLTLTGRSLREAAA